jgi:c-di-GMP-binding flagellar brake protein YcgR
LSGQGNGEGKKTPEQRRVDSRQSVSDEAEVQFVRSGSIACGQIVDLSVGGCGIRTEQPFPQGIYTRVEVSFRLHGLSFRLGGVIQAVHDRHTVGIRFLDVSERKRELILELLRELTAIRSAQAPVSPESAGAETSEEKTA